MLFYRLPESPSIIIAQKENPTEEPPGGSTPSQYALPPGAEELQDLIEYREMNFAIGNIFKACYRKKDGVDPLYDIRKILWFAKREERRLLAAAEKGEG